MPVIQAPQIADLVATTLKELGELRFTDISAKLQRYIAMSRLMKKDKVTFFGAGYGIQWDIMIDDNGSAQFVGLYATDNVNVPNVMTQGSTDWRHITWNWALDRREIAMNGTARRIVDLIRTRRYEAFISAVKKFEAAFWSVPAASDPVSPFGVPYWIVKSATAATQANNNGFNGGNPSGYSSTGGLDASLDKYNQWRNYTDAYTQISRADFVAKAWRMADMIMFEPPVEGHPSFNTGDDMGWYTNYPVYTALKQHLESQNDDLGGDIDSQDGRPRFRRSPIVWVPQLDVDTTNPLYAINWGEFKTAGLRGEWLHETAIPVQANQHTVSRNHVDCSLQWFTRDRRRHGVISNGTTQPTQVPL